MQLSCYPLKFGPSDNSKVVYLDPRDLAIEASLGEEGGFIFQVRELLDRSRKGRMSDQTESGVTFTCRACAPIGILINCSLSP